MGPALQLSALPRPARSDLLLGLFLLAHVAFLILLKQARGLEGEMLWVSHVSLALAGLAFLIRSDRLAATVFILTAGLHATWLVDAICGLAFGYFPLGLTRYLLTSDWLTLLGTSHHLYLTPLVAWWLRGRTVPIRAALVAASILLLVLASLARVLVPPTLNVNLCQAVLPRAEWWGMVWFNHLPAPGYLAIHWAFTTAVFFVPGALSMNLLARRPALRRSPAVYHAPTLARAFTLIELIAVIVVLVVLSAVAIPKFIDYSSSAATSADKGSIAGINAALNQQFLKNRVDAATSGSWITAVTQIKDAMHTDALPNGITIVGSQLKDLRGNFYDFTAETSTSPARVALHVSGGGS